MNFVIKWDVLKISRFFVNYFWIIPIFKAEKVLFFPQKHLICLALDSHIVEIFGFSLICLADFSRYFNSYKTWVQISLEKHCMNPWQESGCQLCFHASNPIKIIKKIKILPNIKKNSQKIYLNCFEFHCFTHKAHVNQSQESFYSCSTIFLPI